LKVDGLSAEEVNKGYRVLRELLQKPGSGVQLSVANSIWTQTGLPILDGFMKMMRQDYGAEVSALDFQDAKAPGIMNDWVKKNTNGKIDKIIDSPIDPHAVMFLMNAVYFKGSGRTSLRHRTREIQNRVRSDAE
jgi:serine protease inhibitor